MTQWLQVFGRLHPLTLHLPIGLLVGLAAVEAVVLVRRRPAPPDFAGVLVWLAAASACVAAGMGFVLSYEDGYGGETLTNHLWLGIAVAVGSLLAALLHARRFRSLYGGVLAITLALLIPTGHFGNTMTRGEGFLTQPLRVRQRPPGDSTFALAIAPIFEARCVSCHSDSRHKGGLSLHGRDAILKGGKDGSVIVASKPQDSEMVRRLRLPIDDDDHMPPKSKPQPTPDEIGLIEAWIAAGAPFDGQVPGIHAGTAPAPPTATAEPAEPQGPAPADPAAIAALQDRLVHVEPVARGSNLLWIDFAAAAPTMTDKDANALLEPLREQVADLSLARSAVTDEVMAVVSRMPNLTRLDVRATAITDAGVAALGAPAHLEELVLAQTHLTDAAADHLLAMPALKRVHVWHSGLTPEAIARLRAQPTSLEVEAGDRPVAAPVDSEKEIKLTGDAPLPGQPPVAPGATSLEPINKVCPVSGDPVNPNFTIVYHGRVIGFCCANCPGKFWADPAKYEKALPK